MKHPLRILLVLPFYGGSLPIGRYCIQALRDLGHTVMPFNAPDFYPAFSALRNVQMSATQVAHLETGFINLVSQAIYAQVENTQPDLVLCMAQAPLARNMLKRLKQDKVRTAMWFMEDHSIFTYWRAFAPFYDAFFVIQKEPFLSALAEIGQENAFYLPMAALPSFHKAQNLSPEDQQMFGSEISFVGAGYPNRRCAFQQIAHADFKIWGSDWEGATKLGKNIQRQGARISSEDSVKIFTASRINLNLHSSMERNITVVSGDFVNPRTFELAACKAFQLVDTRSLLPELFPEGAVATFTSMESLQDQIQNYLQNPEARANMAQKTYDHVIQHHTYQQRMTSLLEHMHALRPFESTASSTIFNALPDRLDAPSKEAIAALLVQYDMPYDAPFADLVLRIRANTGPLSPIETSLVFLDEWKKQYSL